MTVADALYEQHIRQLPVTERLQLLSRIAKDLAVGEVEPTRRISDLRGLGKDVWLGIDGQTYVDQLRDEWELRE